MRVSKSIGLVSGDLTRDHVLALDAAELGLKGRDGRPRKNAGRHAHGAEQRNSRSWLPLVSLPLRCAASLLIGSIYTVMRREPAIM
jgi:hypothetical protein